MSAHTQPNNKAIKLTIENQEDEKSQKIEQLYESNISHYRPHLNDPTIQNEEPHVKNLLLKFQLVQW